MVGFLVFWIPVEGSGIDRSGLAITTILAAQFMMYDAKVTTETTWLDYYFAIMLCFQFFSFVLTVHSARMNRYTMSHGGDDEYVIKVFAYQDQIQRKSMAHRLGFFIFNFVYGGLDAFWIDRWARRRVEINRRFGTSRPNFEILSLGHIEVDSADFWTNRLLSSSSRSTAEEILSKLSRTLTLKSS